MRVASVAVLLVLLTAGCAHVKTDTPASGPPIVATQPRAPQPAAKGAAPESPRPAPAAAHAAIAKASAPKTARPVAPAARKMPAAATTLDLDALTEQLKETKAIGFFTKITLRNQVNDLLDKFREYYQGNAKLTMTDLRQSYDLLMMKVLSLLQDQDQGLTAAILSSREAIWGLLSDPKKFATLQG